MELIFESMLTLNLLQVFTLKMANKIKEKKSGILLFWK